MSLLKRSNCAPHLDDMSGNTYDSKGKVCGGLSSDDKLYIALGGGLCGIIILGLGITYLVRRHRKSRSRSRALQMEQNQMLQTSHNAPLLGGGGWGSQRFRHSDPHMDLSPISTISSPTLSYPSPPSPVPGSSYSPNPETFHFPILAADGYLLPPAPASAARSPSLASIPPSFERPLPSPPMDGTSAFSSRGPSSDGHSDEYAQEEVVGLWSNQGYGDEMDIGQANVRRSVGPLSPILESPVSRTTPRFNAGLGFVTPHSATIYDSASAPSYTYDERGALVRDYR